MKKTLKLTACVLALVLEYEHFDEPAEISVAGTADQDPQARRYFYGFL